MIQGEVGASWETTLDKFTNSDLHQPLKERPMEYELVHCTGGAALSLRARPGAGAPFLCRLLLDLLNLVPDLLRFTFQRSHMFPHASAR